MTWKTSLAVALGGVLLAGTAYAQAPSGSSGSSGSPGGGAPTPGATGTNPCPPGQVLDGKTCAPARVDPGQPSRTQSKDRMESKDRMDKSMEKMDKRMGSETGAGQSMDRQQVKSAQEALKDKGFDPGEIDGAMGPRTTAALREFQKAEGLRVTGRLDSETRSKLGI
jgi:Putative peptidoglycan binding domain